MGKWWVKYKFHKTFDRIQKYFLVIEIFSIENLTKMFRIWFQNLSHILSYFGAAFPMTIHDWAVPKWPKMWDRIRNQIGNQIDNFAKFSIEDISMMRKYFFIRSKVLQNLYFTHQFPIILAPLKHFSN